MKPFRLFRSPLFCLLLFTAPVFSQKPIGVNLASFRDWSSEFVFKDAFKMCREWTQVNLLNGATLSGSSVPLRADGYPTALPFSDGGNNYGVRTYLFTDTSFSIPEGDYTLISDGIGTIRIRQNGGPPSQNFSSPGTHTFTKTPHGHFIIEIIQSQASDPVRNIRFVMPGFADSYETEPFHPDFLAFLDNFQCIRFMDWMRTNGSTIQHWSERTPADYYSQTLPFWGNVPYRGVAYEYLVQLCNRLDKDAWVNIPHQADDAYIGQFAQFLKDHLDPELKIYVEYSNEVWNTAPAFSQSTWVGQQGQAMGYPGPVGNQRGLYTAKRSADIFRIFDSVFADESGRLVKVLAGQAGNTAVAQTILNAYLNNIQNVNPTHVGADALAIAPYFGTANASATDVDNALNQAEASLLQAFTRMENHHNLLLSNNWELPLIAYEGGQHFVGNTAATNAIFCEANRHERMREIYCDYLNFWFDSLGGLFVHYNSTAPCANSGNWGLKEYTGQPDSEAPKYRAILECSPLSGAGEADGARPALFRVFPNPTGGLIHLQQLGDVAFDQLEVFDLYGRLVYSSVGSPPAGIDLSTQPQSVYVLVLKREGMVIWQHKILKN